MRALSYSIETVIAGQPRTSSISAATCAASCGGTRRPSTWRSSPTGPSGVGTRYRAQWANSGPTAVEVVQFDRPRSWETHTNARGMGIRFQGAVSDAVPGARYTAYLELQPRRLARLVAPLALWAMRRQDQKNMRRIRQALESTPVTSD